MICGDRVSEMKKSVGSGDWLLDRQFWGHTLEEWRMLDVGGGRIPRIQCRDWGCQLVPVGVPGGNLAVNFLKQKLHLARMETKFGCVSVYRR